MTKTHHAPALPPVLAPLQVLRAVPDYVTLFSGHADPATMGEIKEKNVYVKKEAQKIANARTEF